MRNVTTMLVLALVVVGCAAETGPIAGDLDGSWTGTCSVDGVRREAGDPDEPITGSGPVTVVIDGGHLIAFLGCPLAPASDDGTTIEYGAVTCPVLDGTERTSPMTIFGTATRQPDGGLHLELDVFWDRVVSGWTEDFVMRCDLARDGA